MNFVNNCDSYINIPSLQTYIRALTPCSRNGNVMFFLRGTDEPVELTLDLNKRQDNG
jgi:hypothetical protein